MRHGKLTGLMSTAELMARVAADARSAAYGARTRQSGTISVRNSDGTRTLMGPLVGGGASMATHVGDTVAPGRPTGLTASAQGLLVTTSWPGTLEGGVPGDYLQTNVLVDGVAVGHLTKAGSVTVRVSEGDHVVTATAEDDACADDGRAMHNVSEPCAGVPVSAAPIQMPESQVPIAHLTCDTVGGEPTKAAHSVGTMPPVTQGMVAYLTLANGNTAASPVLSIDGGDAHPIMTNGTPYAYAVPSITMTLLWDGSVWQSCSTPVYGPTAIIGDPAGANVTIDSDSVDFRTSGTSVGGTVTRDGASFNDGSLQLGSWHVDGGDGTSLRYATIGTGNTATEFGGLYLTRGAGLGIDRRPGGSVAAVLLERGNGGHESVSMYGHDLSFYRQYGSGVSRNLMSSPWQEAVAGAAWYALRGFCAIVQVQNMTLQSGYAWRELGRIDRVTFEPLSTLSGGNAFAGMGLITDGAHIGYLYVMTDGRIMARAASGGDYSGQISVPVGNQ